MVEKIKIDELPTDERLPRRFELLIGKFDLMYKPDEYRAIVSSLKAKGFVVTKIAASESKNDAWQRYKAERN
jgi:ParB-like chromosome segregation protein Spo0J